MVMCLCCVEIDSGLGAVVARALEKIVNMTKLDLRGACVGVCGCVCMYGCVRIEQGVVFSEGG